MTADLVVDAFRVALFRQKRKAPRLVHSDRGSQYASEAFRKELKPHGYKQSMSRKADCWGTWTVIFLSPAFRLEAIALSGHSSG
jgi:transposase InsO family protein